jgi:hypothetical protein
MIEGIRATRNALPPVGAAEPVVRAGLATELLARVSDRASLRSP